MKAHGYARSARLLLGKMPRIRGSSRGEHLGRRRRPEHGWGGRHELLGMKVRHLTKRLSVDGALQATPWRQRRSTSVRADSGYKRNADQLVMEVIGMLREVGVGRFC